MDDVYDSVRRAERSRRRSRTNPVFPTMVAHMVAVGEETGQLEHMLSKIADFYEAEVDAKVKALTSLIEPIMIIFVGAVVGFIVISMYLPIFSCTTRSGSRASIFTAWLTSGNPGNRLGCPAPLPKPPRR